ncbi:thioester-containing protein 1 allele R1 [Drosophila bipectinata]|uniref:thioester-containing protein 1 allele R1 n=1 Tax=Drosophila bipectinata TaxID=42026 RepID=UPI0038B2C847
MQPQATEMESIRAVILVTVVCLFSQTAAQGLYSIIAPNTVRPNSQFHVAVSLHNAPESARFKVGILGSTYTDFKTVEIRPFSTQLLHFEIPDLKPDRYRLTAEGQGGVQFTNETQLHFEAKQHTVLVQTDKSIYKPGDLVHYRVLVLDSNLKPARAYGRVHVDIKDSGDNIIRSYKDIRLTNSIYSNELRLSDYPRFGTWSIVVEVAEQTHSQTFEILDHILPKFVVDIDTPKNAIYKDGKITATVKAHYAFGQPIVGEATLSIYPTFFGSLQPFVNDLITRKVVPIDGNAYFEFDIENELHLKQDYERQYLLDALVEEKSTGSVQNYSTVLTLHLNHYRVETVKVPSYYIPGVPFEATARIARNDGQPLRDFNPQITAYLTNVYGSSEMYNRTTYSLDASGEIKMKFTVPLGDRDEFHSIIVDYLGVISEVGKVPRKHLHSKSYVTAKILNDKPTVNQEISVVVRSYEPIKYFMYQVVGRGDIILSRNVDVSPGTFHTIKFLASFAMMPRAKLLVYTVINGEFVYDEQVIQFEENLLNAVQIEAPIRAPPGQDIDIGISTKPYSYVGLMLVDQNAAALRSGNDLTHKRLMDALRSYELSDVNTPMGSPGKESGVITMSNTDYFIEKEAESNPVQGREASTGAEEDRLTTVRKTDIGPAHKIEVNTLPPGKGRYAFSYTPKPFWHNPRVHVMRNPADTWLFLNISASSDGRNSIHRRIPSDMTSWVVSGFALDPVNGLGLSSPNGRLEAYKEFYITTELPYSIRRDELIALPFVVHNNRDSDLNVEVTFYNSALDFDFPQLDPKDTNKPKIELYRKRSLQVPGRSARSVSFIVTPKRVGSLPVKAMAASSQAGDTVEQNLLVEHPGATERINRGFLFELNSNAQNRRNVTIQVPRNAIPESTSIEVSAVGDLIGSIVGNLENLILLPSGCGEQTMVKFVPNLMVLRYFGRLRQLTPEIELEASNNLALGYQRLLYYRHENGAFSAFGLDAKRSSTWLTAYVARSLRQAAPFIQVDSNVLQTALTYLASVQSSNGGFEEHGDVFERFGDDGISLTGFVTLALMENVDLYPEYRNSINKALDFITRGLDGSNNLHAMALGTYVLSRANHNAKAAFLQRLDSMAINGDGHKWWNKTAPAGEQQSPWYNATRSVNIEISAYAALALLENNLVGDALPVLNWLMDQRNSRGGFVASQDTVVGLQALLSFAERFSSQGNNVQVGFHYGEGAETIINVNAQNSLALQTVELPNNLKNLSISATGRGMALAQVSYKYNTNVTSAWPRFVLDPTVNRNSHADYLHLSACASFVSVAGEAEQRSNMAVMEVQLPSGFVVDRDTLPTLESSDRIKKVETQNRNTKVVIYFDYLDRREVCPTLHAYKTVKVTKHRPVAVVMYDYYDNARRARQFYRAPKSNICDICEHANCGDLCEKALKRESGRPDDYVAIAGRSSGRDLKALPVQVIGLLVLMVLLKTVRC